MSTIGVSQLKHLAIFVMVIESGSFAAAARKLSTSRSRVSEQVAELESLLGVRLIQRSTRQLAITPEGKEIYELARNLPKVLQDIEAINQPETPRGRVSLTLNNDIALKHLAPVLDEFSRRYPMIQLDLVLNDERLDLIAEQIDVAIRIGFPRDDALVARVMHEERFTIFASPDYLTEQGTPTTLEQLEQHRWLTLYQASTDGVQDLILNDKSCRIKPENYFRCNSPLMVQQMVIDGLGLGCLLPITVKHEIEAGALVPVMPQISSPPLIFTLVYPSRRQVPLRVRCLIDYLLEAGIFG